MAKLISNKEIDATTRNKLKIKPRWRGIAFRARHPLQNKSNKTISNSFSKPA
jgi:hypothetical protein